MSYIRKFLTALISSNTPHQIAMGFAIGTYMGLTPSNIPINIVVIACLFLFNINSSAGFIASGLWSLLAYIIYPFAHKIGLALLTQTPALTGLWTTLYNAPFIPYTHFNNTVMLGSLIIATLLFLPTYFGIKYIVTRYRNVYHAAFIQSKLYKAFKSSKFIGWLVKLWRIVP